MTHLKSLRSKQSGIALLMTIMVLGVVLSVTLAIVELSLQHLALSVDSKDSEIAFHAANAGLECARYYRRHASSSFETGASPVPQSCFGTVTPNFVRVPDAALGLSTALSAPGVLGSVFRYKAAIQSGLNRCSVIDMVTMVVQSASPDDLIMTAPTGNLGDVFPGYANTVKRCAPGATCTIALVAGYNVSCLPASNLNIDGVLKRQVLLEF